MPIYTIDLSTEVDDALTDIAARAGITKAEAMRRAFGLLTIADDLKRKGNERSLGIVRENEHHELVAVGRVVNCLTPNTDKATTVGDSDNSPNSIAGHRVVLNEVLRLRFLKQVLAGIAVICFGVCAAFIYDPKSPAANQLFEFVKIGALPLITLVVVASFSRSET
jgi:hypothetical protein